MTNFFGVIKHGPKAGKYVMETIVPKIKKNLTKLRNVKEEGFKAVDNTTKGTNVSNQKKSEIKKSFSEKISNIINPEKKATGGRVGLKRGTNLDKIKKTFGPSKNSPQSRMTGKKNKKKKGFPDVSGDGKITKKDILMARGVIPKPKKKVI